jgi:uncharacterized protein (TIGR02147 family)
MTVPSVQRHLNFRDFLKSYYQARKKSGAGYSYRRFSEDAGLASPNLLKLVIDGRKNLTTATLQRFATALKLTPVETEYFEALVLENQATDGLERSYYRRKLRKLRTEYRQPVTKVRGDFGLFDHPLLPAVLMLLPSCAPENVVERLRSKLGIGVQEIQHLVQWLLDRGIASEREGKYFTNPEHYLFHEKTSNQKLKSYLRQQLRFSINAFERAYERGAKFYSHAMAIDPKRFEELQSEIQEFIARVNSSYELPDGEEVVQVNIQNFLLNPKVAT